MNYRSVSSCIARACGRSLLAIGLLLVLVICTPLDEWWVAALRGRAYDASGDVMIVLGGDALSGGIMGWHSYVRSYNAALNFKEGGFKYAVISGGTVPGPPVALAMADWMECHGVPAADIRIESSSLSTRENAVNTERLIESLPGRKVLLTSDYHMFRAVRVFRKLGLAVSPQPIADVAKRATLWSERWSAFVDLATETCKIGYYWSRGWI